MSKLMCAVGTALLLLYAAWLADTDTGWLIAIGGGLLLAGALHAYLEGQIDGLRWVNKIVQELLDEQQADRD